jgi:dipeptidyl aminopeptidase/acylaminoacyl peptidase
MSLVTTIRGVDQIALAQPGVDGVATLVEPVTSGPLPHREPIWSRDGRFIAYTRQNGENARFADIISFELARGEIKNLTGEKAANVRHSLDSVPGRNLISFVTRDGDWYGVAVVNVDNKAGWMITREAGDKLSPRFAPTEARLVYIRSEGFSTVLAERGLHGTGTIALDPGEGVASAPIWAGDSSVVYAFSAPHKPLGWLAQENSADAERNSVELPEMTTISGANLRHPVPIEFDVGPEEQFSGLLYQSDGLSGPVPGVVYMPDGPLRARLAGFQREEQALATSGMSVLAPVIHGTAGFGVPVEEDLADFSDGELEAADLAAAGQALGSRDSIDASKLVLVGHGFGGTLAMTAAGARPSVYQTVVAIDPVTDWTIELDAAESAWRQWIVRQYGLPLTNADRYALRTPETFVGVIDADLLLVSTAAASPSRQAQLESFMAWLDDVGVRYTKVDLESSTISAALCEIATLLAGRLQTHDRQEDV